MTDNQKNCIELMALGFMNIDDAAALCNCSVEDFATPECKEYEEQYINEFNNFINGKNQKVSN